MVLNDGSKRVLVGCLGFLVEASTGHWFPCITAVTRPEDAAFEGAAVVFAADRAIEHDDVLRGIRTSGKALDIVPREPGHFFGPGAAAIVRAPNAGFCGGEHDAAFRG